MVPKIFYVTEKAWNYYPFTITEYSVRFLNKHLPNNNNDESFQCSFIPRFSVNILTKYENNNGCTENCLNASGVTLDSRIVETVDIVTDPYHPYPYLYPRGW